MVTLNIPALRERKDDLVLLINSLLSKISQRESLGAITVSPQAMQLLKNYDWPGNVRELENVLERAINFIGTDKKIEPSHLPSRITGMEVAADMRNLKEIIESAELEGIKNALRQCKNRKTKAAQQLGISRTTLYEKMVKYGLCEVQNKQED